MTERAGEASQETAKAMKRRGILAAAGAVVAGIMATQTALPVAAAGSLALEVSNYGDRWHDEHRGRCRLPEHGVRGGRHRLYRERPLH